MSSSAAPTLEHSARTLLSVLAAGTACCLLGYWAVGSAGPTPRLMRLFSACDGCTLTPLGPPLAEYRSRTARPVVTPSPAETTTPRLRWERATVPQPALVGGVRVSRDAAAFFLADAPARSGEQRIAWDGPLPSPDWTAPRHAGSPTASWSATLIRIGPIPLGAADANTPIGRATLPGGMPNIWFRSDAGPVAVDRLAAGRVMPDDAPHVVRVTASPIRAAMTDPPDVDADQWRGADVAAAYRFDGGDTLAAHATLLRILGAGGEAEFSGDELATAERFSIDASLRIGDSITPSIQYFRTIAGASAPMALWPGHANSAGVIAEVAYAPWTATTAPFPSLDLTIAARYVAYTEFNGGGRGAAGNNAIYLSLWAALRF